MPEDTANKGISASERSSSGCCHQPSQFFPVFTQASLHFSAPSKREGKQRGGAGVAGYRALRLHSKVWETCLNLHKRKKKDQVLAGPRRVLARTRKNLNSIVESSVTLTRQRPSAALKGDICRRPEIDAPGLRDSGVSKVRVQLKKTGHTGTRNGRRAEGRAGQGHRSKGNVNVLTAYLLLSQCVPPAWLSGHCAYGRHSGSTSVKSKVRFPDPMPSSVTQRGTWGLSPGSHSDRTSYLEEMQRGPTFQFTHAHTALR